ncbi:MAG: DUF4129 domain-containing protein [Thermanaerothrix sp.]|nr:DUF4129 domain-containing protein [Thermanaerothrix sp.]
MSLLYWAEIGIIFQALAEVVWATLWYHTLVSPRLSALGVAIALFLVVWGAERLGRGLERHRDRFSFWAQGLVMVGYILGAMSILGIVLAGFSIDDFGANGTLREAESSQVSLGHWFWHGFSIILLVWRGLRLGKLRIDSDAAVASLRFGIVMLLAYGLYRGVQPTLTTMMPVFLFLAFSLGSIGVWHMMDLFQSRGGYVPSAAMPWWIFIIALGFVFAFVGVVVGAILERPVEWISWGMMAVVAIPIVLVAFVFGGILLLLISWLIPLLGNAPAVPLPDIVGGEQLPKVVEQLIEGIETGNNWSIFDRLLPGLALAAILILLALVVIEMRSPGTLLLPIRVEGGVEERLRLSRLVNNLRRARRSPRSLSRASRQHIANRIRAIYQQLLDLAEALEHPRPPAATPLEFLPTLVSLFPEHTEAVRLLTHAYIQVRYGEIPEDPEDIARVERAWQDLASEGQRRLQEKRNLSEKKSSSPNYGSAKGVN